MTARCVDTARESNPPVRLIPKHASVARDVIAAVARVLWPRKTASELAARSQTSSRACEYWLARQTDMSADALAAILRSDEGFAFLEALIGDAKPAWWKGFKLQQQLATLRRGQEQQRRMIEQLERAAAE